MVPYPLNGSSHLVRCAAALVAAMSFAPSTALAQKVLVGGPAETVLFDLGAGRVAWSLPLSLLPWQPVVFTSDGRYVVTTSGTGIRVIDAVGGSSAEVPMSFQPHLAHPRDLVVYGLTGGTLSFGVMSRGTLARLDPAGLSTYGGCAPGTANSLALSGDGHLLFERCDSGDLVVLDAATGAVLRTLPLGQDVSFDSNFDGSALVVARSTAGGAVELLDSTTGTILNSTTVPAGNVCTPGIGRSSRDRTTVVVNCWFNSVPLPSWSSYVLSAATWTWGATLAGLEINTVSIAPDNSTAFATYAHRLGFGDVRIYDLASGAITLSVPGIAAIAVSYAPLAPALAAAVTGRLVDLSWTLPPGSPAVTGYALEIGSAPGLTDLGTVAIGSQSTLTVPAVPPGRYYARLRAENASGQSAPSGEVTVDVL